MIIFLRPATRVAILTATLLTLGACSSLQHSENSFSPGAVRGQDQGQNEEIPMTREQAEAQDSAPAETPAGTGYNNNPGILSNPAMGNSNTVHHVVHHVHYSASGAPPTGYRSGVYEVPNNENPDARKNTSMTQHYHLPAQHVYNSNVTQHHHYYNYGSTNYGKNSNFGQWHPNAFDGAGSIDGFTD